MMQSTKYPLEVFSQQGFEASHYWHKAIYHRSTNHDGNISKSKIYISSMSMILQRIYRAHTISYFLNPTNYNYLYHLKLIPNEK